jgi:hypothetical protein
MKSLKFLLITGIAYGAIIAFFLVNFFGIKMEVEQTSAIQDQVVVCNTTRRTEDKRGFRNIRWNEDETGTLHDVRISGPTGHLVSIYFVEKELTDGAGCPATEFQPAELPENYDLRKFEHDLYILKGSRAETQLKEQYADTLHAHNNQWWITKKLLL